MPRPRSFLFLQGPLSPLYRQLGEALEREGHAVCRINLCFGDWLHWRRGGAVDYRGRIEDWSGFVADMIRERAITDVVLHGDQRPYHKLAAEVARGAGARVIVTELGYLRPDWMTLELDGCGTGSLFPRTAGSIRQLAAQAPAVDAAPRYPAHFINVALPDIIYNLTSTALWFLYPHFQRHTIYFPPLEYLAWAGRLLTSRRREQLASAIAHVARATDRPCFVVPLQLEGDFQIRAHSPFRGQAEGLDRIVGSFARHAPADAMLLVKTHPLDNGLERWGSVVAKTARLHGIADRVRLLDGGRLDRLWPAARGLVTINSSAGLEAILAGVPVKALGPAIYDVPGLTHQGPLDSFWQTCETPDMALAADFVRALAASVQVRGTIYSREGLAAAVANMARRILDEDFLLPGPADVNPVRSAAA